MARKTVTLLSQTGSLELDKTGDETRDSYYGFTDGIHTVAIYGQDLSGRVKIQGTLALIQQMMIGLIFCFQVSI